MEEGDDCQLRTGSLFGGYRVDHDAVNDAILEELERRCGQRCSRR
jgi:hypothetical protein